MPLTDSLDAVTQAVYDKLVTAATAGTIRSSDSLAILDPANIFYGDQAKYPAVPALAVEPNNRTRDLQGVSYRTENNFTVYLLFYHAVVGQSEQLTRKQIQEVSEVAETLIHQDPQLGGLLIHCFCVDNESGYTYRPGTLYRTNRVTFTGYSKTALR